MHVCAIVWNLWYCYTICWVIKIPIVSVPMSKTNKNTNIYGLIKKGEYKYKYIQVDKKERIQIWIFELVLKNTNTNGNICHTLKWSKNKERI